MMKIVRSKYESASKIVNTTISGKLQLREVVDSICDKRQEEEQQQSGVYLDAVCYARIIKACTVLRALNEGRRIHSHLNSCGNGMRMNIFLGICLIRMYGKCESISEARCVFQSLPYKDVVAWTTLITAYAQNGQKRQSVELFNEMEQVNVLPNDVTLICVLAACTTPEELSDGRKIHARAVERGFGENVVLGNAVMSMYSRCGHLDDVINAFEGMIYHDVVSWNVLITAHIYHSQWMKAIQLFHIMQQQGMHPNSTTFVTLLNACTHKAALPKGKWIHRCIQEGGVELDYLPGCALVNMYAKCGSLEDARRIFDEIPVRNVVTWTAIITAYTQHELCNIAMQLFHKMQLHGVLPNEVTLATVINACGTLLDTRKGLQIHKLVVEGGYESDAVIANCLIDMYGRCGRVEEACNVFHKMQFKDDAVTWTTMIVVYVQLHRPKQALALFNRMLLKGLKADRICYAGIVNACANLADLSQGRRVHQQVASSRFSDDLIVANALVDMYNNCGSLASAYDVFQRMKERDVVTWNTIMAAFSQHGYGVYVPDLFCRMQQEGVRPDDITFVGIISACSHAGLLDHGRDYFRSIAPDYGLVASAENCGCMVDLLGRSGHLAEAEDFIKKLPRRANNLAAWMALLGACKLHQDVQRTERIAEIIAKMDPGNVSCQVALSNVYSQIFSTVEGFFQPN